MKILRAIRFIAAAAAGHAAFSTAALTFIPNLYPTAEMAARVQYLVFCEAIMAFVAMLGCYLFARAGKDQSF